MRTEISQAELKCKLLNTMLFPGSFPKLLLGFFFCILCYINKVNPGLASFDIFLIFLISFSFVWKKTVK